MDNPERSASSIRAELATLRQLADALAPNGEPTISFVLMAVDGIKTPRRKLGVFSASFNPLTNAHLKMIEESEKNYGLNEILLLLAKANVDKGIFGASLEERLLMLKVFAQKRPNCSVAASSHGKYIEKVKILGQLYPPNTEIFFIIGYDTLVRVFDAKYYTDLEAELNELFSLCRFIVANRSENDANVIARLLAEDIGKPYADKIDTIELSPFYANVSSTDIRERIKRGQPADDLAPSDVLDFIQKTLIYSGRNGV